MTIITDRSRKKLEGMVKRFRRRWERERRQWWSGVEDEFEESLELLRC